MHENYIGLFSVKYVPHSYKYACGNIVQVLPLTHDVQIVIRLNIKYIQHLVQHLPMLSRDAYNRLEFRVKLLELLYKGAHLDCLWPGSKNE